MTLQTCWQPAAGLRRNFPDRGPRTTDGAEFRPHFGQSSKAGTMTSFASLIVKTDSDLP